MLEEEHRALIEGSKKPEDIMEDRKATAEAEHKESLSVKKMLLSRTTKIISVQFEDNLTVDIKVHLPVKDLKKFIFLQKWTEVQMDKEDPMILDSPEIVKSFAEFMAFITVDNELDKDFWMSDDIDPFVGHTLLEEYLIYQGDEAQKVRKFRNNKSR